MLLKFQLKHHFGINWNRPGSIVLLSVLECVPISHIIKSTDKWNEWHWSWLQDTVLVVNSESCYLFGCLSTPKTRPNIVSDKAKHPVAMVPFSLIRFGSAVFCVWVCKTVNWTNSLCHLAVRWIPFSSTILHPSIHFNYQWFKCCEWLVSSLVDAQPVCTNKYSQQMSTESVCTLSDDDRNVILTISTLMEEEILIWA